MAANPGTVIRSGVGGIAAPPVLGAVAGAVGNNFARQQVSNLVGGGPMVRLALDGAMMVVGVGLALRGTGAVRGLGWGVTAMSGKNLVDGLMAQFGGQS